MDPISIEYFPVSSKWCYKANIKLNKDELAFKDYNEQYKLVGRLSFENEDLSGRVKIFQNLNDNELYIYVKDMTSGLSTYPSGRFSRIIKEKETYFVDFNTAYAPACAHLKENTPCPRPQDKDLPIRVEAGEKM